MTSRERVQAALGHDEADRVPLDLGGSNVSSMHVNAVYALRQALGLDAPGTPVKVIDPSQMLGEITPDLMEALGVDVVGLRAPGNKFGIPNADWKEWTNFQGTPVLVPGAFNTDPEPDGSLYQYPHNDRIVPPSGHMPKDGLYFDVIVRQDPFDEAKLDPADNCEEFGALSDEAIGYFATEAARLRSETDKAVVFSPGGMGFGDIANVPAPQLKHPKGIRDLEEWYMSTLIRPEYVYAVFERQCEIALANQERLLPRIGDQVDVLYVTGTDFGTQRGPFIAPETYRQLFQPFHKRINEWVHTHTPWKTFIHSCGSVWQLIPDFIEAGFDILNPVQCSAADMDPRRLKDTFGKQVTFWGGGVDTQKTLPFGTPEEVRTEVKERLRIFAPGGGFVFNTIHNVQSGTPVENLLAMYETVREYRNSR
jgi:hypothetical protein